MCARNKHFGAYYLVVYNPSGRPEVSRIGTLTLDDAERLLTEWVYSMKTKQRVTAEEVAAAKAAVDDARKRAMKLEDTYNRETVMPIIRKLVGRYLIFRRNCYSCPTKPSDYWDCYCRVDRADGRVLHVTEASVDSRSVGTIERKQLVCFDGILPTGWAMSSKGAFDRAVRKVMALAK